MSESPREDPQGASADNDAFVPNQDMLKVLTDMGISKNAATKGLFYTGNFNADLAAAWVFENEGKPGLDDPLPEVSSDDDLDEGDFLEEGDFHKMVFVINMDLKMGVGKVAAQVGHAAVGLYKELCEHQQKFGEALLQWEQFGETKIVLKGNNREHLEELQAKAESLSLASYMVMDAGRTQIAAGSKTVLGIMGKTDIVDQVTGQLSLL